MLEMRNIEVYGLYRAQRAIGNSYSVGAIDTTKGDIPDISGKLGANMAAHQSHDAYLKGIIVQFDLKYSLAITPELQRYHFIEIVMSQSTMHSLKGFMAGDIDPYSSYVTEATKAEVSRLYKEWCIARDSKDKEAEYTAFMRLRHNIPSGFEMWETITTNYLQLKTICIQRTHHRQREDWDAFIKGCLSMPLFSVLTGITEDIL